MQIGRHVRSIGFLICGLVLLVGLMSPTVGEATTYYTATTGNDSNPGTSTAPFGTLARGVSALQPGDTLYVRGGTYSEYTLDSIPGGTSWSAPVTVAAYPGETVVLQPRDYRVLHFEGSNTHYIVIDGLILDGSYVTYDAVKITSGSSTGTADHIRLKNCEVRNAPYQGILITEGSDANEFLNLKVHDNGTTDFNHGFYITSGNNLIERSAIYRNAGWGVHLYTGDTSGAASSNIVRNNQIYNNARVGNRGPGILLGSGTGNMAYNNLLWGNNGGIQVDYGAAAQTKVYYNTVYNNRSFGITVGSGSSQAVIRNNIVYKNGGGTSGALSNQGSGTTLDHNLAGPDPKFVNAAAANFHLQSNSPAINKGMGVSEVATDYDSVARPQGAGYDIGGYEYYSGTPQSATHPAGSSTTFAPSSPTGIQVVN